MKPHLKARRDRAPSQRQLRVGEELRHALARILASDEVHDPALAGLSLTVTEVRMSPDLKHAKAFVVPLGGDGLSQAVAALNRAAGFLGHRIAGEVELRNVPRLEFAADETFDTVGRVREILDRPRVQRDLIHPESGDANDP